jgi:hypothetical protein
MEAKLPRRLDDLIEESLVAGARDDGCRLRVARVAARPIGHDKNAGSGFTDLPASAFEAEPAVAVGALRMRTPLTALFAAAEFSAESAA